MAECLNFRIVIVPSEFHLSEDKQKRENESVLVDMKHRLEECGLSDVQMDFLKLKKSDDEEYPEIEELVIQVQAKFWTGNLMHKKVSCYKEFCKRWKMFINNVCAILVLYESDSFISVQKSAHCNVLYSGISFGVLPFNDYFFEYASLVSNKNYVNFFHDTQRIVIKYRHYEFIISYSNIRNIFVNIASSPCEIFLDLFNPPLIFRVEEKQNRYECYSLSHRTNTISEKYTDYLDVFLLNDFSCGKKSEIDIDVWGRANTLRLSLYDTEIVEEIIGRIHFYSEKPIYYANFRSVKKEKPVDPVFEFTHFGCTYLMTAIFKRNFTMCAQAPNLYNCICNLSSLSRENGDCLEKALTVVLAALDSGKIINFWHAVQTQYNYYLTNNDEINFNHYIVPEKCRLIRRITLTPTRILLWPQEIMYGNRVLRQFDSDYALRVSFRDDNMSRLSFNALYADDEIFDSSIKRPMSEGIRIGSRTFEFLAWSNSQIRDHGVWMYSKDKDGNTVQDIRAWMGDFSHIHSVSKYMARMGQCFSQTEDAVAVPLDSTHVKIEKDVEGGYDAMNVKPYCFSDGIGKISPALASEVRNVLGHDKLCSAFQIRYGGFKGMLVIDPTLKDTDIVFRNSMKKFDSPKNTRLEIAKTSAPINLQLNRPFITILNDMGVRHRTFLKLQEEMLRMLTDMLFEEEKASAFLTSKTPSGLFNYNDISQSGIYLTTEPFFRCILLALHRHHVANIKSRANIAIDPSQGRNMLGVMDETGLLLYGQVFVQYTKDISYGETTRDTVILKGEVLVTKNPCLLPGDVRKFQAVDIPELHHIVDCIVFPQKGSRPHPNEMAGSDLDGDEYAVVWNKDLIFYASNEPPGNFPSVSSVNVYNITVGDMIEFLIEYIKKDTVGVIANAHLAHADNYGIHSRVCIEIAKKFSVAVDYAKNGVNRQLERSERPTEFPDFMEKTHKASYKSKKALGKMYRVCKDFESENEEASMAYQNIQVDPDLVYPGWEDYKQDALKCRNKFNTLLRSVLRNYGIQHEAEVFSGAFTNLHCRFQERKDRAEIEKVVLGCIKKLSKNMKEEFLEEFSKSGDVKGIPECILQKASAWYIVTYSDKDANFLSFAWVASEYLANIKVRKVNRNTIYCSPIVSRMDEQIRVCESQKLLPFYSESRLWLQYSFLCDPGIVKLALRALILWAQDEQIIEKPGCSHSGLLYLDTFVKLFLHVAEQANYIFKKDNKELPCQKRNYSSAALCLEFLAFCMTLRFHNKYEIDNVLPFKVYKYNKLSKQAVVTYHRFALSGVFQNLYFESDKKYEKTKMKSEYIDYKCFPCIPISNEHLKTAQDALTKYSRVDYVSLREIRQTKKVCVSAYGSEQSLKSLKSILRKDRDVLKQLFATGVMTEKKTIN